MLAVALIASVAALAAIGIPSALALAARQSVAASADAAALAAADTAMGVVPGTPCETATTVAASNGATLTDCVLDGAVATVAVSRLFGVFTIRAAATAGPPED